MCRMASLFTRCESIRLFLLGFCKNEVYQGRAGEQIQFRRRIKNEKKAVWKDCATDLKPLRKAIKQFIPRSRAVEEKLGYCIKMIFG